MLRRGSGVVILYGAEIKCCLGKPLCKNSIPTSIIFFPLYCTIHFPEFVNSPITVASTPRLSIKFLNIFHLLGGTASVIRSCDSEIQISHGRSPRYFRGTFSRRTFAPPHSLAISATEQEIPPAPLSVMLLYRFISRASLTIASLNFF